MLGLLSACNTDIEHDSRDLENISEPDEMLTSYSADILIIPNIAELLTYRNYYQAAELSSDEVNDDRAHLTYVEEEDPVLFDMLNDRGEIIVGNLFFRFLANGKVAIAPSSSPAEMETISSWSVDHADLDYNIMMIGYADSPELLFGKGDSGVLESKDIVELRFDVDEMDNQFILKNNSFVALLNDRQYSCRWLVDGEEIHYSQDLMLAREDYLNQDVRLQLSINDEIVEDTEDTKLEVRTGYCDHGPRIIQTDDCEYSITVRFNNRNERSNVRFFFFDGPTVEAENYGTGGATTTIKYPTCIDGKFYFSFEIYDVYTGEVYCSNVPDDEQEAYWAADCESCDCNDKTSEEGDTEEEVNGTRYRVLTRLWISDNIFGSAVGSFTRTRRKARIGWRSYDAETLYCSFEATLRDKEDCPPFEYPFLAEQDFNSAYLARNINTTGIDAPRYVGGQDLVRSTQYAIVEGTIINCPSLLLP